MHPPSDASPEREAAGMQIPPGELQNLAEFWNSLTPELRGVVLALADLPEAVKAGIVAMVKAAAGKE